MADDILPAAAADLYVPGAQPAVRRAANLDGESRKSQARVFVGPDKDKRPDGGRCKGYGRVATDNKPPLSAPASYGAAGRSDKSSAGKLWLYAAA